MENKLNKEELIQKVNKLRTNGKLDLSMEEDLSIGIMNLISLEEHLFFTAEKTKDALYFKMLAEIREMRKELMSKMLDKSEGETWCISKHLLAASMRLMEVGTKLQSSNKEQEAKKIFDQSYELYSMFWALRLKLTDLPTLKENTNSLPETEQELISKMLDCCKE